MLLLVSGQLVTCFLTCLQEVKDTSTNTNVYCMALKAGSGIPSGVGMMFMLVWLLFLWVTKTKRVEQLSLQEVRPFSSSVLLYAMNTLGKVHIHQSIKEHERRQKNLCENISRHAGTRVQ